MARIALRRKASYIHSIGMTWMHMTAGHGAHPFAHHFVTLMRKIPGARRRMCLAAHSYTLFRT